MAAWLPIVGAAVSLAAAFVGAASRSQQAGKAEEELEDQLTKRAANTLERVYESNPAAFARDAETFRKRVDDTYLNYAIEGHPEIGVEDLSSLEQLQYANMTQDERRTFWHERNPELREGRIATETILAAKGVQSPPVDEHARFSKGESGPGNPFF